MTDKRTNDEIRADVIAAHYLEQLGPDKALRLAEEIVRALATARADARTTDTTEGEHDG